MRHVFLVIFGLALLLGTSGCSTVNSRKADNRISELEMRIQKLESGSAYARNQIPMIPDNIETITPAAASAAEMGIPERKMPKLK
ncbi:hypothetical protein AGMMS50229_21240 [Campylobacterota bacterium]|nr:hypothetical protein AGMMS50229_21240 [Campylobacterota bacterium]